MIFRRSLVRELTATAIALFVVLLAILFTQSVIRILARAAGGAVAAEGVLALIGFNAMFYLNLLLSVALFLTVLLTLSRWYRDSELVVWFTSGQSLSACLKPSLLVAAPCLVAMVVLSRLVSRWGERR
jgi:lipopolysaccharide export system permease protein